MLFVFDAHGVPVLSRQKKLTIPRDHSRERTIAQANEHLSRVEQLKKFRLLDVEWRPDSEELTPTMKVKRKQVATKYAEIIDELYS